VGEARVCNYVIEKGLGRMASLEDERIERDPVAPGESDFDNAPRELPAYLKGLVRAPKPTRRAFPVDTKLPSPSGGVYGYYEEKYRYGIKETIDALVEAGRIWSLRHDAPRIGVGDISKQGGGDIPGHVSHEKGIDADIRPMRNDGIEGPVLYTGSNYSRALTQELVDILSANGKLAVQIIWFNDPGIVGVYPLANHSNHLHVRFLFPDQGPPFPFLARGSKGTAVRELQRRLNFWIMSSLTGYKALVIDGDFGDDTYKAVSDFQSFSGITADGRAGKDTWPLLPIAET
jgi:hypothetical protein